MSAKIELIGQSEAKEILNGMLAKKEYSEKRGESYQFQPLIFKGLTGLGKTEMAERLAKTLNLPMVEVPPNAGWTFWREMSNATASIDNERGTATAIPSVIFFDETHSQKILMDVMKIQYGNDEAHLLERNGTKNFFDPFNHLVIFASNQKLDTAIERRARSLQLVPYSKAEKKQLLSLFAKKHGQTIEADALEFLESRVKPTAGEIKNLCKCLSDVCADVLTLEHAETTCKLNGYFTYGLNKIDLQILMRLEKGIATAAVLKFLAMADKKRDVQILIDWLIALNLVQSSVKSGFMLTDAGHKYLSDIREKQGKAQIAPKDETPKSEKMPAMPKDKKSTVKSK